MSEEQRVGPADDDQSTSADSATGTASEDSSLDDALNEYLDDNASQQQASNESTDLDKLRAEVVAANERALRAQAEVDNVRRRFRRENDEAIRYANKPLLTDLLPVIDNIHRALEAAKTNPESGGLLEGVSMVADQLVGVLEKHHCPKINAIGEQFDPELHEAILQQPSDEPKGTIILVAQDGYQLHDRLVRPSQVIVSTGPAE
ncbi:MAG: nucleotide exchange factor GrpE [Planctomycetales bacterium]|nr:nucleotide exchange factor GrpE [Planctomycetales bacterium]